MASEFASEGFDLDAMVVGQEGGDTVIYELGGGATVVPTDEMTAKELSQNDKENAEIRDEMHHAEEWKRQGNEQFKDGNYLEAYDMYTNAIEACPDALTAEEILKQRDEFREAEREKAFSRQRLDEETRRNRSKDDNANNKEPEQPKPIPEFQLAPQPHADKLAVYYCNRAAALIHLERYHEAINDCDVSILLQPTYAKAFVRRSSAFEKSDQTEEALRDAKTALELEPANAVLRKTVARLQKIEDERLEKLKAETLGKLKDLGNSILGNFGLSLDNFQAVQDPKTGSYSISFNQK